MLALRRLRQEDHCKLGCSRGYIVNPSPVPAITETKQMKDSAVYCDPGCMLNSLYVSVPLIVQ